jgi:hypothetical protein
VSPKRPPGYCSVNRLSAAPFSARVPYFRCRSRLFKIRQLQDSFRVCLCLFFAMQCGLSLPWRKHYSVIDFLTSRPFVCTNSENAASSSLLVLLPQLQETMFTDLLQSLLRSSNQGHRTLLQLCYSLRNHPTSCCRVALPVAGLLLISDDLELPERESRHRPGLCDGIVMVPTPLSPELNLDAVDHRDPCCEEVPPGLGRRRR